MCLLLLNMLLSLSWCSSWKSIGWGREFGRKISKMRRGARWPPQAGRGGDTLVATPWSIHFYTAFFSKQTSRGLWCCSNSKWSLGSWCQNLQKSLQSPFWEGFSGPKLRASLVLVPLILNALHWVVTRATATRLSDRGFSMESAFIFIL